MKPGGEQYQTQARQSQKGGDKKGNILLSISKPAEITSGISNNSNNTDNS